ncbi:ABC transporter substrate-binding protein [Roseiarcaceae bacterium H3SJ34-1]|uniref:ABC transporter substrate-binding protein n=1 Tax=Terripilifer ovatus TaxID=3032367 RepID=UPI003AB9A55F|nr:ABC transporter substrate-binding protein [Roseiarcaceae bacterium H3SJ34-1]
MTLKGVLFGLVSVAAAGISQASAQTVKIGWINSYSGFLAQAGDQMEKGLNLYIKLHTKDLPPGVKVEFVRRDDTAAPEVGKRVAQELITRERVQLLMGIVASPVAAAVAPLTAEAKVPLVITNAGGVAITRISPYVVRFSFTQWHTALPIGAWSVKQGWKRGFSAVADFIPGHDAEGAFVKGFTDAGGQMLGTVRFPPATADYAPFVQRIKDAKPDVAFVWVPAGPAATAILKAIKDLGVREAGINVVSTHDLLPDEELPNIGAFGAGILTAGNYSTMGVRPANQAFLKAWDEEYKGKAIPNFTSVAAWDAASAVFDLIKKTNGKFTGDEAMKYFATVKLDSPRGPIAIDPATRDIIQDIYIRRSEMKDGKLINTDIDTMKAVKDPWKELNPPK